MGGGLRPQGPHRAAEHYRQAGRQQFTAIILSDKLADPEKSAAEIDSENWRRDADSSAKRAFGTLGFSMKFLKRIFTSLDGCDLRPQGPLGAVELYRRVV